MIKNKKLSLSAKILVKNGRLKLKLILRYILIYFNMEGNEWDIWNYFRWFNKRYRA